MGDKEILDTNKDSKKKRSRKGNEKIFSALKDKPFNDDVKYLKVHQFTTTVKSN